MRTPSSVIVSFTSSHRLVTMARESSVITFQDAHRVPLEFLDGLRSVSLPVLIA